MQIAWQVPVETSSVKTQESETEQAPGVGQAPGWPAGIPVSQVSPDWITPSPQVGEQSGSVAKVAPGGQQPSLGVPGVTRVMATCLQTSVQPLPWATSVVQATPSSQLAGGQAPGLPGATAVSQLSPGSMRPLPQRGLDIGPPPSGTPVPPSTRQSALPQESDRYAVVLCPAARVSAAIRPEATSLPLPSLASTSTLTSPAALAGSSALSVVGKASGAPPLS